MARQAERREATVAAILAAAQKLFATRGFSETTIDDIGRAAGVAKGAVYHHFGSKEEIFERVLDSIFTDIAAEVPRAAAMAHGLVDSFVKGTEKYFECVTRRQVNRIVLIDGPAVLGWNRWREIDLRHFGRLAAPALHEGLKATKSAAEIDALFHLLTGAITEAALVCAVSREPKKKAHEFAEGLRVLLSGIVEG